MKVLIVEDEKKVQNFLKKGLVTAGFTAETASSIDELFKFLSADKFDALVLDRLLGGTDAIKYIGKIREQAPDTRIVVLSALSDVDEKVQGLSIGADDYLGKPFHIPELIARLKAVCRRAETAGKPESTILKLEDLTIYLDSQRVERAAQRLDLTAKEYKLLVFLVKRTGKTFSKADILTQVWELQHHPESNVVEVVVNRLRNKVDKGFNPPLIHSRRGEGYWAGRDGSLSE